MDSDFEPMMNANCCDRLQETIRKEWYPLTYDFHVEEVQLKCSDGIAVVRYCPFCGQKLESGRSALFTKMTEEDRNDIRARLQSLQSLDEAVAALGPPDEEGTGGGFSSRPWKKWACYRNLWQSIVLTVGEHQDGGISWSMGGQPAKRRDEQKSSSPE